MSDPEEDAVNDKKKGTEDYGTVQISALRPKVFLEVRTCMTLRKRALRGVSARGSKAFSEQNWDKSVHITYLRHLLR